MKFMLKKRKFIYQRSLEEFYRKVRNSKFYEVEFITKSDKHWFHHQFKIRPKTNWLDGRNRLDVLVISGEIVQKGNKVEVYIDPSIPSSRAPCDVVFSRNKFSLASFFSPIQFCYDFLTDCFFVVGLFFNSMK